MTKLEYIEFHRRFCEQMVETTRKKNSDYTGSGDDPFANFRQIGNLVQVVGVDVVKVGFLTRITDKLSRLASFIEKGKFEVADESFIDSCLDASNYLALLAGYHLSTKKEENHDKQNPNNG